MEKKQAQEYIEKVLQHQFDPDSFALFISNLLNDFDKTKERGWSGKQYIYTDYREHINNFKRLGVYTAPYGEEVEILIIKTETLAKLDRARTALRNFVVKWLQDDSNKSRPRDYALAAFYSGEDNGADWRFSFIKVEHEAYKDEKGKVKIRKELTPARRYSYLVGEHENSYTAQKQLLPLLEGDYANPNIDAIENAFSVEKVTGEFFQQYKELYHKLCEYFNNEKEVRTVIADVGLEISRFTKKLLGQIVFLYFLQKKGWLGVKKNEKWGSGDKKFLRTLFDKATKEGKNFYSHYLQYLFYEALARERENDAVPGYYARFDCKIPFLNGGLFEAEYDWQNQKITIPDTFFHNQEKNKGGDVGTGILDVFDRYNFTIKEDEPLEKEVAVDPEMLGKVFENMLDIAERKSTGSYYTPREIVHYMCQESLIHYLDKTVNAGGEKCSREELEQFIRAGHLSLENDKVALEKDKKISTNQQITSRYHIQVPGSIRLQAEAIDEKLEKIKICDPAIGSGAFPVGLLHEIVNARLMLQAYIQSTGKTSYELKRHAIQESIYGVDIDPSAVDIARLRLWLSLIVDEEDFDNIDALPNLDYKIMQGNSLISEFMGIRFDEIEYNNGQKYVIKDDEDSLVEKFKDTKDLFQKVTDSNEKEKLRQEIDDLIIQIFETRLRKQKEHQDSKLKKIEKKYEWFENEKLRNAGIVKEKEIIYNQEEFNLEDIEKKLREFSSGRKVKPFFPWKLYFAEIFQGKNSGFDLVIGNPPYVQIQKFSGKQEQKDWEKQGFQTYTRTGDVYCLFYEKGNQVLRDGGTLTFITSNKWMRANYGKNTRKYFLKNVSIHQLIDFGDSPIFKEATTYTNIIIFSKKGPDASPKVWDVSHIYKTNISLETMLSKENLGTAVFSEDAFIIAKTGHEIIKKRIEEIGIPLKKFDISIYRGILTGLNQAFIIHKEKKDELISKDPNNEEIIKPILRGKDIKRYEVNYDNCWLIDTHNGYQGKFPINIDNYPVIKEYLNQYREELKKRLDKGVTPYNLRNCAYHEEFEKEKIIWGNLALKAQFALSEAGFFVNAPSNLITPGSKYLLAVLNSSIGDFYIRSLAVTRSGGYFEYKPMFIERLPVPKIPKESQKPFEILVDYVMFAKKRNLKLQAAFFDQLIDGMVFELYFAPEIKAAKKEILNHLQDLQSITEKMPDEEKLTIINSEFDRLYDPYHPVRNHLETLSSIEPIRIVQNALK